jgi:hypothetical protein
MDIFMIDGRFILEQTMYNPFSIWASFTHHSYHHLLNFYPTDKPLDMRDFNEYQDYEELLTKPLWGMVNTAYPQFSMDLLHDIYSVFATVIVMFITTICIPILALCDYIYDIFLLDNYIIYMKLYKIIIFYILGIIFYKKSIIHSYQIKYYNFELMKNMQNKGNTYLYYLYLYFLKKK